jgi:hypothetical protein
MVVVLLVVLLVIFLQAPSQVVNTCCPDVAATGNRTAECSGSRWQYSTLALAHPSKSSSVIQANCGTLGGCSGRALVIFLWWFFAVLQEQKYGYA